MLILQDILSQEIIQKLGWTLLHFIWQAAAVAFILTILLRLLRKSTANLRYIIACLALVLIVLLPVITIQLVPVSAIRSTAFQAVNTGRMPVPPPAVEMSEPETIVIAKPYQPKSADVAPSIPFKQRAIETLEPALPYIVSGWLIGVFALSIWHLGGWAQLQRLKRRMVKPVDDKLRSKLKVLAQRLRVKQTVQLMESALVQIPTVVGWLRPVILLPASALTGLTSEQLEAILAHELAHIKRFDYLINILQTVVEILGFYHPAVWWVSHKIRAERENCCDDLAVSISGDRVRYAKALTSMEEIRSRQDLAVAATGGNLSRRICRLVGKDSAEKTSFSWIPAATTILLIAALLIPTALALTAKSDSLQPEIKTDVLVEDEVPWGKAVEGVQFRLRPERFTWKQGQPLRFTLDIHNRGSRPIRIRTKDLAFDFWLVLDGKLYFRHAPGYDDFGQELIPGDMIKGVPVVLDESVDQNRWWSLKKAPQPLKLTPGKHTVCVVRSRNRSDLPPILFSNPVEIEILPNEEKPDVHVENDRSGESQQEYGIPTPLPAIAKSPTSSAEDKALVQVDCLMVEVFTDLKMDRETTVVAENILEKVTTVPRGQGFINRSTTAARLLREAAEATAPKEDDSGGDKRVTQEQFKALVEMLASRGLMKILMNPTIHVADGQTAMIEANHNSLRIAPRILSEDGGIILQVEAAISSKSIPQYKEQTPISSRKLFTRVYVSPGESLIIGGLEETGKSSETESNIKDPQKQTTELLFILTPTIIKTDNDSEKKAESADKLKILGLAVAMYADDHDKKLPDTLEPLKPYIANEQDYLWIVNNVEYICKNETYLPNQPRIPVAYDKTQKEKQSGANVLFLDGHVEFLTPQRLSELDIKRAKFLIEAWLLAVNKDFIENIDHNADSPDEAKELLKLKTELLAAVDGSNKLSFIPPERNVSLLLKAVRAHKDSKVLSSPQLICQENKTAEIKVINREYYLCLLYTSPSPRDATLSRMPSSA